MSELLSQTETTRTFRCYFCNGRGHPEGEDYNLLEMPCGRCKGAGVIVDPILPGRCPRIGGGHAFWGTDKGVVCSVCDISKSDVPFIVVARIEIEANSDEGLSLQRERAEGGFHWRDDVYFKRLPDGSVRVKYPSVFNYYPSFKEWTIPPNEWASIVCSVSALGEDLARWNAQQDFHGRPA